MGKIRFGCLRLSHLFMCNISKIYNVLSSTYDILQSNLMFSSLFFAVSAVLTHFRAHCMKCLLYPDILRSLRWKTVIDVLLGTRNSLAMSNFILKLESFTIFHLKSLGKAKMILWVKIEHLNFTELAQWQKFTNLNSRKIIWLSYSYQKNRLRSLSL